MTDLSENKEGSAYSFNPKKNDQNSINPVLIIVIVLLLSSLNKNNNKYIESQAKTPMHSDVNLPVRKTPAIDLPINIEEAPVKRPPHKSTHARKLNLDQIMNPDQIADKLVHLTDVVRQVSRLNSIKNTAFSGNGSLDHLQEALGIFKHILPEHKHIEKLNNIDNMLNNVKRFGDIKKMMELQSKIAPLMNNNGGGLGGLDDMLKVVAPLVSGDNSGENMENLQKIMKMANLISSLNSSGENN